MKFINIDIRKMEEKDLDIVEAIDQVSFISHWNKENYKDELLNNPFAYLWVIELSSSDDQTFKQVAGYIDFYITFDSASIAKIAIHPEIRKHQLGLSLMEEMQEECIRNKVNTITLEVRASNKPAIKLYEKCGFVTVNTKKGYYEDGEDALYMVKEISSFYANDSSN